MSDIKARAIKVTCVQLNLAEEAINGESNFIDDLGADSLDTVELVMAFEEEFGFVISDTDAEKIRSINDVVDVVTKHLAA